MCQYPVFCSNVVLFFRRDFDNKEKGVDTSIAVDVGQFASRTRHANCRRDNKCICSVVSDNINPNTCKIVILSGDGDMFPVVESALAYGWHVDLAAFPSSFSKVFKKFDDEPRFCKIEIKI